MAIKAVAVDEKNLHHLIIGLNRKNLTALLAGKVVTFPTGYLTGLTEGSDVVVLFAETDEDLEQRFPPARRPAA